MQKDTVTLSKKFIQDHQEVGGRCVGEGARIWKNSMVMLCRKVILDLQGGGQRQGEVEMWGWER